VPTPKPKMEVPDIKLTRISSIFEDSYRKNPIHSDSPQTFEQLKQKDSYVFYSTNITANPSKSPAVLEIKGLADRAHVFVDSKLIGILSRTAPEKKSLQINIDVKAGSKLDILVENVGRICFGSNNELKGILSDVTLEGKALKGWNHYKYFSDWDQEVKDIESRSTKAGGTKGIPSFFAGTFTLANGEKPLDTFLRLDGWGKGLAFLNGFNLGRYWKVGPQVTYYSPSHLFKAAPQTNTIVVFETDGSPCDTGNTCTVKFVKDHLIDSIK